MLLLALLLATAPPLDELISRASRANELHDPEALGDLFWELESAGRPAVPGLLLLLDDASPEVRRLAAAVLERLPVEPGDLDDLIDAAQGGERCALQAIAHAGTSRALRYFLSHVGSDRELAEGLRRMNAGPLAGRELAARLRSGTARSHEEIESLRGAMESAHDGGDELLAIAQDASLPLANRLGAVHILGSVAWCTQDARSVLRALAKSDPRFEQAALAAIDRMDGRRTFRTALDDFENATRRERARAITPLGAFEEAVPSLLPLLDEPLDDGDERLAAVSALGDLRDPRAIAPLIRLLDDPDDWRVVYLAAQSLGRLGATEAVPALERVAANHWFATVREMARYSAAQLRGPSKGFRAPSAFDGNTLHIHAGEYPAVAVTDLPGMESEDFLERHPIPKRTRPCDLLYRHQRIPSAGLRAEDGVFLADDRGEFGGELVFETNDRLERIADGNTSIVARLGANVVAVVNRGTSIYDTEPALEIALHPGESSARTQTVVVVLGPMSGALFRIARRPDGTHDAKVWKVLPGYCSHARGLDDGSLLLGCQDAAIVVHVDGTFSEATNDR